MKTCTNCGEKKPDKKFVEQCGDQKIVNYMCEECRKKAGLVQKQADSLIKIISKRIFA